METLRNYQRWLDSSKVSKKDKEILKNMSQAELAKQLGVSKSRISMYELGQREPDFYTLEVIADYFNVDMDYLLGKKGISTYVMSPKDKEAIDYLIAHDEVYVLLERIMKDDDMKGRLLKMMEILEDK